MGLFEHSLPLLQQIRNGSSPAFFNEKSSPPVSYCGSNL